MSYNSSYLCSKQAAVRDEFWLQDLLGVILNGAAFQAE